VFATWEKVFATLKKCWQHEKRCSQHSQHASQHHDPTADMFPNSNRVAEKTSDPSARIGRTGASSSEEQSNRSHQLSREISEVNVDPHSRAAGGYSNSSTAMLFSEPLGPICSWLLAFAIPWLCVEHHIRHLPSTREEKIGGMQGEQGARSPPRNAGPLAPNSERKVGAWWLGRRGSSIAWLRR
jgi:hypothetical protein